MTRLRPKPVRWSGPSAYPTRLDVLADPQLLRAHIPASWLSKRELAGVLGVLMAFNAGGCSKDRPSGASRRSAGNDLAGKAATVAPIFEHGEGRGATGCIVFNPPMFLSEEEALLVIAEELAQTGLQFSQRNVRMEGVSIPGRVNMPREDWVNGRSNFVAVPVATGAKPFVVDLEDSARGVAVEFVSQGEYHDLGGCGSYSTVQEYDFKDVARWVQQQVREQGKGLRVGVFYDPVESPKPKANPGQASASTKAKDDIESPTTLIRDADRLWKMSRDERVAESKRLLRLQVKDFVDWLKGQGVI